MPCCFPAPIPDDIAASPADVAAPFVAAFVDHEDDDARLRILFSEAKFSIGKTTPTPRHLRGAKAST